MQTVEEIRLEWLKLLIARHGTIAALNAALGRARTDATLSQLKNQATDIKSGNPRNMGSTLAREIEDKLGLERGTLDNPPPSSTKASESIPGLSAGAQRIVQRLASMESTGASSPQLLTALDAVLDLALPEATHGDYPGLDTAIGDQR